MAERPLLLFPEAQSVAKAKKSGGGEGPKKLGAERQQQRLGARLEALEASFEAKRVQVQTTPAGVVPEDVLVLETAGKIEDFVKAARLVGGFEFLAEYDVEEIEPDDDFFVMKDGERVGYGGRVYLGFSNQGAFREMLGLWRLWQNGGAFRTRYANWRNVFSLLRDIRPWSVEDRLEETGVLADWKERIEHGQDVVPCEIELWFRTRPDRRRDASAVVRAHVHRLGGQVVDETELPDIRYHGLAARLPQRAVQLVLDASTRRDIRLVQSEQVQFFRAAGQMAVRTPTDREPSPRPFTGPNPEGPARIALFDGLPLQNHDVLKGRLMVDDPDGWEPNYPVHARAHGTAMASLIVWGDLNAADAAPIPQPLYVRPILQPVFDAASPGATLEEALPEDTLTLDLIHGAVRRLFEADTGGSPVAPRVAIVNLSVGVRDRPFLDTLSPFARLLDWLSWKYQVLFLVSAGNHMVRLETGQPWSQLEGLEPSKLAAVFVRAIVADTRNRRVFSPAEAVNVLTIGATHDDRDRATHAPSRLDPVPVGYPSPLSAHGLGYKRSVKPDLLLPGGRVLFNRPLQQRDTRFDPVRAAATPGLRVAAPGAVPGDLTSTIKSRGTSNATALAARLGALLASVIDELREGEGGDVLASVRDAVLLKALLAHGARWGALASKLGAHLATGAHVDGRKRKQQLTRLLGFGRLEVDDVVACTKTRVTAVGAGVLQAGQGAEHRFPLPPSLSGKVGRRRLTITLAWFTPVNPLSHRWRKAQLWFETPKSKLKLDPAGPDALTAQRGTLQHGTFEGNAAAAIVEGDYVRVHVSCREDAPGLTESVPYALAVTLEVAEALDVDVYTEVRDRIRARVRVEP